MGRRTMRYLGPPILPKRIQQQRRMFVLTMYMSARHKAHDTVIKQRLIIRHRQITHTYTHERERERDVPLQNLTFLLSHLLQMSR